MKKIILCLALALILVGGLIVAQEFFKIELVEGKNEISINYSLGYASSLAKIYSDIETITYTEGNETIGYVNIFGGIGKDFMIQENKPYEINSKKNITIYLK